MNVASSLDVVADVVLGPFSANEIFKFEPERTPIQLHRLQLNSPRGLGDPRLSGLEEFETPAAAAAAGPASGVGVEWMAEYTLGSDDVSSVLLSDDVKAAVAADPPIRNRPTPNATASDRTTTTFRLSLRGIRLLRSAVRERKPERRAAWGALGQGSRARVLVLVQGVTASYRLQVPNQSQDQSSRPWAPRPISDPDRDDDRHHQHQLLLYSKRPLGSDDTQPFEILSVADSDSFRATYNAAQLDLLLRRYLDQGSPSLDLFSTRYKLQFPVSRKSTSPDVPDDRHEARTRGKEVRAALQRVALVRDQASSFATIIVVDPRRYQAARDSEALLDVHSIAALLLPRNPVTSQGRSASVPTTTTATVQDQDRVDQRDEMMRGDNDEPLLLQIPLAFFDMPDATIGEGSGSGGGSLDSTWSCPIQPCEYSYAHTTPQSTLEDAAEEDVELLRFRSVIARHMNEHLRDPNAPWAEAVSTLLPLST